MTLQARVEVHGHVSAGFELVRQAFADNFSLRNELGAACCVFHRGEKVVDLWGGIRNAATGEPWEEGTMVVVYSATKGLAAMAIAVAHSRGWLDYDERVCAYWPEFAQQGKDTITVRQLLAHQAGLFALDVPIDRSLVADPDRLATVLARQKPAWPPGERQAYHAISLGFYEGEMLRRVDPQHRTLGRFFQDEIATPLRTGRLHPATRGDPQCQARDYDAAQHGHDAARHAMADRAGVVESAVQHPPGLDGERACSSTPTRIYARNLEIPSGGAVGTARAIAHAYSVFATGGRELGLRAETLRRLARAGDAAKSWVLRRVHEG